ncbi:MAG TPA: hypothetical protein VEY10_00085 [Flavisolibacter sp.]|jgi:hypothetical protein|nr:hypothetical protein [Flavisolibacter sp.]
MIKIPFKIWAAANAMVFCIFAIALFPLGIGVGFTALLYSGILSLPAILLLYCLLRFLQHVKGPVLFSWLILFLGATASAVVPYFFFQLLYKELSGELSFILPLSIISGYSAVLLFAPALHYLFLTFQYQAENENH